ncbi:hypothetical protein ACX0G7_11450 [Flavitalea antarctica]
MNLPKVLANLVKAQNDFDSTAYADCFSETAVVFDEGKTHTGRKEKNIGLLMPMNDTRLS